MDVKRQCLVCDRELGWLARQKYEFFCSSGCKAKYRQRIDALALERLTASGLAQEKALAAARPDAE